MKSQSNFSVKRATAHVRGGSNVLFMKFFILVLSFVCLLSATDVVSDIAIIINPVIIS